MSLFCHVRWLWIFFIMILASLFLFPKQLGASQVWLKYFRKDTLLNNYMRTYAVGNDCLYVGTWGDGIVVYNGNSTKNINSKNSRSKPYNNDGLINDFITCLCIDEKNGRLWIGTNDGLSSCKLDFSDWKNYTTKDGLPNNVIRDIAIDIHGNVWVGTPLGIAVYNGQEWKVFDASNGLIENSIHSITIEGDAVWVATVGGTVVRYKNGVWKPFIYYR